MISRAHNVLNKARQSTKILTSVALRPLMIMSGASATMTADLETANTVKTRILIVSDTHSYAPAKSKSYSSNFHQPLPPCDIFIHAGDMTNNGTTRELEKVVEWISKINAEVKIIIAGMQFMFQSKKIARSESLSINQSSKRPSNQSINSSINQSLNWPVK